MFPKKKKKSFEVKKKMWVSSRPPDVDDAMEGLENALLLLLLHAPW